jgi:putative transcriptional regulator
MLYRQYYREFLFMTLKICIDDLLEERERTFYWLSKQTGISHTTLWRLKKGKALGINFITLEKICEALECTPGEVLKFETTENPVPEILRENNPVNQLPNRTGR